jgi:flagellar biogenesis protein FliO
MRFLLVVCFLFLGPFSALADEASQPAAKPKKIVVGQDVANFGEAANSAAKSAMYFFAVLLLGFSLWKRYDQKRNPHKASLVKITSKTPVSSRAALLIAEVEGHRYLLSQTPDSLSFIAELRSQTDTFQEILSEEFAEVENG